MIQIFLVQVTQNLSTSKCNLFPLFQPQHLVAQFPYLLDGVAHQDGGGTAPDNLSHLCLALFPEGSIPHRKYLVQDEDIRLHQGGDGKG